MRLPVLTAAALSVALWLPAAPAADLTIYSSLPLVGADRVHPRLDHPGRTDCSLTDSRV